jgi:hypothetical protein
LRGVSKKTNSSTVDFLHPLIPVPTQTLKVRLLKPPPTGHMGIGILAAIQKAPKDDSTESTCRTSCTSRLPMGGPLAELEKKTPKIEENVARPITSRGVMVEIQRKASQKAKGR